MFKLLFLFVFVAGSFEQEPKQENLFLQLPGRWVGEARYYTLTDPPDQIIDQFVAYWNLEMFFFYDTADKKLHYSAHNTQSEDPALYYYPADQESPVKIVYPLNDSIALLGLPDHLGYIHMASMYFDIEVSPKFPRTRERNTLLLGLIPPIELFNYDANFNPQHYPKGFVKATLVQQDDYTPLDPPMCELYCSGVGYCNFSTGSCFYTDYYYQGSQYVPPRAEDESSNADKSSGQLVGIEFVVNVGFIIAVACICGIFHKLKKKRLAHEKRSEEIEVELPSPYPYYAYYPGQTQPVNRFPTDVATPQQ